MGGKRRVFGAAFKAKVALAAAKGDRTTAQLASQFRIHTSQVTAWKKQLMGQMAELFVDGRQRRPEQATDEQELYEQICRLYTKRPFLGIRKIRKSFHINRKRAQRLMERPPSSSSQFLEEAVAGGSWHMLRARAGLAGIHAFGIRSPHSSAERRQQPQ